MELPSPEEFKRLGVCDTRKLALLAVLVLRGFLVLEDTEVDVFTLPLDTLFLDDVFETMDCAVGGRELMVGGCGKEPILIVFLTVREAGKLLCLIEED
jgi:hypothetical protein